MHKIELKRLTFSNVLSYGNNENVVDFTDGLTWIKGPNGAGKSTIVEALTFALFGSPYRDINKAELRNNTNTKATLSVKLEFNRTDANGTDEYCIERTMKPSGTSSFVFTKNGSVEKKGAGGTTQKLIENEVFGFDKRIFENVISLNTIQTIPFIDMDPKDKRALIESILSMNLDRIKDANKKRLRELNTTFEVLGSDIRQGMTDIDELKDILSRMKEEKENGIQRIKSDIAALETSITDANAAIVTKTDEYNAIVENGKSAKSVMDSTKADLDEYKGLTSAISSINRLSDLKGKLKSLSTEYDKAVTGKTELENKLAAICSAEDRVAIGSDISAKTTKKNELERSVASYETKISGIDDQLKKIEAKAAEAKSGVPCPVCGKPSTEADVEHVKEEYRKQYREELATKKSVAGDLEKAKSELGTLNGELESLNAKASEYDSVKSELDEFNKNEYMPIHTRIESIKSEISECEESVSNAGGKDVGELEARVNELSGIEERYADASSRVSELRTEANAKRDEITGIKNNITDMEIRKTSLENELSEKLDETSEDAVAKTQKKLDDTEKRIEGGRQKLNETSDDISVAKFIDGMYQDTGIKKIVLSSFVPSLNKAIARNLTRFGLPFTVEFDSAMDYTFSSRFGLADTYDGLSQGQKRKLNFAIAMAFRDFVLNIADFDINTIFLDEVLDISTDMEALADMIELVRSKLDTIDSAWLITHRGEQFRNMFDSIVDVEYDGRFSSLKQTTNDNQ